MMHVKRGGGGEKSLQVLAEEVGKVLGRPALRIRQCGVCVCVCVEPQLIMKGKARRSESSRRPLSAPYSRLLSETLSLCRAQLRSRGPKSSWTRPKPF